MQYERDESGKTTPLPRPSIDTGMGLERMAAVIQGKASNYETDLLRGVISRVEDLSHTQYQDGGGKADSSMRVIADHARAALFLITDGVFPSNEGRGYVLRRIIRRAVRHAKALGADEPFLFKTLGSVSGLMADAYPEVAQKTEFASDVVRAEEERFLETAARGLEILESEVKKIPAGGKLPGKVAFKLYDTYGFPLDLTEDVLRERNISVDHAGFEKEMGVQKEQSRKSWKGAADTRASDYTDLVSGGVVCEFTGYGSTAGAAKAVFTADAGDGEIEIVTDSTPFYASSGGQVGDTGTIEGEGFFARVTDTTKPAAGIISHRAVVERGKLTAGDEVALSVDEARRRAVSAHHTATHILHSVLRDILGTHVTQAGSLVAPDRLRFDFTHHSRIAAEEARAIEDEVNERILRADEVLTRADVPYEDALKEGAMAIFEEKYGDRVRVVSIGGYSAELCGGTHLANSAAAGLFTIVSQSASSAGVRRIEAVCAEAARRRAVQNEMMLAEAARSLGGDTSDVAGSVEKLLRRAGELEKEIGKARKESIAGDTEEALSGAREIGGVSFVSREVSGAGPEELRELWDKVRAKVKNGVAALGGSRDGKAFVLVGVAGDASGKFHAGNIVKEIAPLIGGRGGGKPSLAQAGGDDPSGVAKAIEKTAAILASA